MSNEFGKLFPAKATVVDRMRELSTDSVMFKSEDDLPLLSVPKSTGVKTYGQKYKDFSQNPDKRA